MTGYVFTSTLREFLQPKRFLVWLVIGLVILVFMRFALAAQGNVGQDLTYIRLSEMIVFRMLAFLSAILSSAIIAGEVEQRTIVYLLTRPIPRWQLLVGRYLACAAVVAALIIFMLIGTSLVNYGSPFNPFLLRDIATVILGSLTYGAIFLAISLLLNRAILFGLLYAFGWETLVANMPGQVFYMSIHNHLLGLANHPRPPEPEPVGRVAQAIQETAGVSWVPVHVALITLLSVAGLLMLFNVSWFSTNEYVAREDAE